MNQPHSGEDSAWTGLGVVLTLLKPFIMLKAWVTDNLHPSLPKQTCMHCENVIQKDGGSDSWTHVRYAVDQYDVDFGRCLLYAEPKK